MSEIIWRLIFKKLDAARRGDKIKVTFWSGRRFQNYSEDGSSPDFGVHFKTLYGQWFALLFLYQGFFEMYVEGHLDLAGRQPIQHIASLGHAIGMGARFGFLAKIGNPLIKIRKFLQEIRQNNKNRHQTLENLMYHYNQPHELFEAVLGETVGYSEGYWVPGTHTLNQAKYNGYEYVCRRLVLDKPDLKVVEVGAGWGYMPLLMADKYNANVTVYSPPIPEQNNYMRTRFAKHDHAGKIKLLEKDHRDLVDEKEQYDRYVSLGVFEHAGKNCHENWVKSIAAALKPGGIGVITCSGYFNDSLTEFLTLKYVFPGGQLTPMAKVLALMEKHGLTPIDVENYWPYYDRSVREWRKNFFEHWPRLQQTRPDVFTERMYRIWNIYLSGTDETFDNGLQDFIVTFVKGRDPNAYPLDKQRFYRESFAVGTDQVPLYSMQESIDRRYVAKPLHDDAVVKEPNRLIS